MAANPFVAVQRNPFLTVQAIGAMAMSPASMREDAQNFRQWDSSRWRSSKHDCLSKAGAERAQAKREGPRRHSVPAIRAQRAAHCRATWQPEGDTTDAHTVTLVRTLRVIVAIGSNKDSY